MAFLLLACMVSVLLVRSILLWSQCSEGRVPNVGGAAVWSVFILFTIAAVCFKQRFWLMSSQIAGVLVSSTLLFIIGFLDDKRELSVAAKVIAQSIVIFVVMGFGVHTQIAGIGVMANLCITFLWLFGVTNAFNHLDIVDGLASGVGAISAFTLAFFAILSGDYITASLFLSLLGGLLGFFVFNFPRARIYLGNAGSHFIGLALSSSAILLSYAPMQKRIALVMPILILGLPIFDTCFLIWMRLSKRRPIWSKSDDHLVLRLIWFGFSPLRATIILFALAAIFNICALSVFFFSRFTAMILVVALLIACFFLGYYMRYAQQGEGSD